ncbi:patatin-like phospholipase domain-containing protein [Cercophora scortea]|uniref:Patatin-like phospholipase domain-containing protein n=1 Tax=Cercophora scortea TaxID=314031 RepID=A0AAE0MJJ2_9PEZI|nr:patatin-like phospholipase domain-containing protein [Cercophora scortea]
MAEEGSNTSFKVPAKAYGFPPEAFDWTRLPDADTNFLPAEDLEAFIQALAAPDPIQSPDDVSSMRLGSPARRQSISSLAGPDDSGKQPSASPAPGQHQHLANNRVNSSNSSMFITAQNDWAPVHEKVLSSTTNTTTATTSSSKDSTSKRRRNRDAKKRRRPLKVLVGTRSKDETREGYLYSLLKWPFLLIVGAWIIGLGLSYLATRSYIYLYEQLIAWRGKRERLRRAMRATSRYKDWVVAAKQMDDFFGNGKWKEENDFAYYDSKTVRRVWDQMRKCREKAEAIERQMATNMTNGHGSSDNGNGNSSLDAEKKKAVEDLKALIEACVKNNFVGIENPRLYSQTYYGTKNLVQNYVDEVERSLNFLIDTKQLTKEEKRVMFKGTCANYGRTALCLSGGATFAYYHFGVIRALLDEDCLPDIITGTSGGALVAALVATRTNDELKQLLVPSLAHHITACREPFTTWIRRWWKTGARFDSLDWAKQCSWWTRGSMTFREAYERTGRILNVSCVPADPHSPTILCNYLTSPDCVIWSAVIASAAVPGILNPVVLMMKTRTGHLVPYSFGHKWKDGSLRTDIPIKALNLHFNVNFTIVSQVNPHINLFFFSSRGSVGSPVTHRKGRGWRGGYLGSATEQYIKLDLTKWLRVLRQLELLPRPLGQDWSQLWLQTFGGTVTIWPKSIPTDFLRILSDPDPATLARMIHEGQQSAFPKLRFVANRLKVERAVERGRMVTRAGVSDAGGGQSSTTATSRRRSIESMLSEDELRSLLRGVRRGGNTRRIVSGGGGGSVTGTDGEEEGLSTTDGEDDHRLRMVIDGAEGSGDSIDGGNGGGGGDFDDDEEDRTIFVDGEDEEELLKGVGVVGTPHSELGVTVEGGEGDVITKQAGERGA